MNLQEKKNKIQIKERTLIIKEKNHLRNQPRVTTTHGTIEKIPKIKIKDLTSIHDY